MLAFLPPGISLLSSDHVLPGNGGTGAALYVMAAIAQLSGSETDKVQVFAQAPYFPVPSSP